LRVSGAAMKRLVATAVALSMLAAPAATPAAAPGEYPWAKRLKDAKEFAATRTGKVSIGIVDEDKHFHGHRANRRHNSASTVKVMLMVAYLRHGNQNHEPLTDHDKALLEPMIKRSDNSTATQIRNIVGNEGLARLARKAGMSKFGAHVIWGRTQITARDQANWMYRIERYIPKRHREYAMDLLTKIIPRQSWGIPPAKPDGYALRFKGGWAPSGDPGWTVNQVAQFDARNGGGRFSLAILTRHSPDRNYGILTIRGIAQRLLKGYPDG
jgi:hypothetical protein